MQSGARKTTRAKGLIAKMSAVDTRNIPRDSLFLLADVRLEGSDSEFRVKVRNLSVGGMLAEGNAPVVPGSRLKISLRNIGWVDGGVAWVQENRFGIAFDQEIDPKLVRAQVNGDQSTAYAHRQFRQSHSATINRVGGKADTLRKI